MGYILKNKNININKLEVLSINNTGKSYKLNSGIALKIFRDNIYKDVITEDECKTLSDIRCDRILMPKECVYKDGNYAGYSFSLLHNKNKKRLSSLNTDDLLTNLELIEDDICKLSNNSVLLDGINPKNLIYCNGLYIPDVSEFKILNDKYNSEYIKMINLYELVLLLNNLIKYELFMDSSISKSQIENFFELLELKEDDERLSNYFEDLLSDEKNISQFVKKL